MGAMDQLTVSSTSGVAVVAQVSDSSRLLATTQKESSGGWYHKTFKLSSKLALTSTMKVRFNASDLNSGSVVEAGVDAVNLLVVTDCGSCPADFDGSGFVDLDDYDAFVEAFELGGDDADFDGSGFVDIDAFDAFVEAFELGC